MASALFGREEEELLGQHFDFPLTAPGGTEFEITRSDGDMCTVEMRLDDTEWRADDAYLATLRDVTERRRLLAEATHINEELRQANQIKEDFIANVSHELRTPLATISNVLSNALAGVWGSLNDKARDELYLAEMKKRAADNGVKSLLIMCDGEGQLGDPRGWR